MPTVGRIISWFSHSGSQPGKHRLISIGTHTGLFDGVHARFSLLLPNNTNYLRACLTLPGISHYCEKVRWALDLSGCEYTEDMHPPGLHLFATIPATAARASMTPVLVCPDGSVHWDSTEIISFLVKACTLSPE